MGTVFANILNMSWKAGLVILIVLIIRLLLKKAPKLFSYILWSAVLFRLLCPFTFETRFSLIPERPFFQNTENRNSNYNSVPVPTLTNQAGEGLDPGLTSGDSGFSGTETGSGISGIRMGLPLVLEFIWIAGMIIFAFYGLLSLLSLKKRLKGAVNLRENIYRVDSISSAFVYGMIRPKIYLPSGLTENKLPPNRQISKPTPGGSSQFNLRSVLFIIYLPSRMFPKCYRLHPE